MLCDYGCGNVAEFKLKNKKNCCCLKYNTCKAVRQKNSEGLKRAYFTGRKKVAFTDECRQKANRRKRLIAIDVQFTEKSTASNHYLKKVLVEELKWCTKCAICGIDSWNDKQLNVELDHIDGNSSNAKLDNLRFLCPNCHSQTDNYCGKNINTGSKKVSDEMLRQALKGNKNIRQALIEVGLAPKGANYIRAYKLLSAHREICEVEIPKFGETFDNGNPEPSLQSSGKV